MIRVFQDAGPFQTNSYLINPGGDGVLIDPVIPVDEETARSVRAILLTHAHFDHIFKADAWRQATGAPLYAHETAAERMTTPALNASQTFGLPVKQSPPTNFLKDGDVLHYGASEIRIIEAPGHAPDCLLYLVKKDGEPRLLITGDVIFRGDIGRCDLPGSDFTAMLSSLRRVLELGKAWPDDLPVYPGHGPASTWGAEKAGNPYLRF